MHPTAVERMRKIGTPGDALVGEGNLPSVTDSNTGFYSRLVQDALYRLIYEYVEYILHVIDVEESTISSFMIDNGKIYIACMTKTPTEHDRTIDMLAWPLADFFKHYNEHPRVKGVVALYGAIASGTVDIDAACASCTEVVEVLQSFPGKHSLR